MPAPKSNKSTNSYSEFVVLSDESIPARSHVVMEEDALPPLTPEEREKFYELRRMWRPTDQYRDFRAAGTSDADVENAVTAAYDAAVAWQERYREEVKKQREEEHRQKEARLRAEFHVSAEDVPTITFDGPDADWAGKIAAVNYIDGFCTRNIPVKKITDPSKTAYRICVTISEYLAKHDPEHCTSDCINAVFMAGKLFPYIYGPNGLHRQKYPDDADDGWTPRKAGCASQIFGKGARNRSGIYKSR